jgi:hypothetical protein
MSLNWLDHISYDDIISTFIDTPIVSVGSGSGVHEKRLELASGKHIICVDPITERWINTHHMPEQVIIAATDMYRYITGTKEIADSNGCYKSTFKNIVLYLAFDTNTYNSLFHKPDYKLIDDLVITRPELVGANQLLIIWSFPNEYTYDVDAIVLLKPKRITIIYEASGSAGSESLHKWIATNEVYKILRKDEYEHYMRRYKTKYTIVLLVLELLD